VEISRQPERGAETGRTASYNSDIISLWGHALRGCKIDSPHEPSAIVEVSGSLDVGW